MKVRKILPPAALMLALACGGSSAGTNPPPPPPPGPPPPPTPTNQVDVNDNTYNPANATVSPGATVTWTWRGVNEHSVTFDDGLQSSGIQRAGVHNRNFAAAGTFRYSCRVHGAGMSGSIVVQ
jgi:plastocyanin